MISKIFKGLLALALVAHISAPKVHAEESAPTSVDVPVPVLNPPPTATAEADEEESFEDQGDYNDYVGDDEDMDF